MIRISLKRDFEPKFASLINRIINLRKLMVTIQVRVWNSVNRYLEETVLENYKRQIEGKSPSKATVERKKRLARSPVRLPRDAFGAARWSARQEFVNVYGQRTGFFMLQMSTHHPLGTNHYMIRNFRRTVLGSQVLIWGIKLEDFWHGYPVYILKGATLSTSGGPGLISLSRSDLEHFRQIVYTEHFLPMLATVGVT